MKKNNKNEACISSIEPTDNILRENQRLTELFKPLFLYFNDEQILQAYSGSAIFFGLNASILKQQKLMQLLPELVGIDVSESSNIPLVTLENGSAADIYIQAEEAGFNILLVDASEQKSRLEKNQQASNVSSLVRKKTEAQKQILEEENTELLQSTRAKTRFISGMSHEFRVPILGMLGNIAWAEKQFAGEGKDLTKFKAIESNATYLLGLVDNLLQQGRISTNQLVISRTPVAIEQLFHSIISTMLPLAEKRKIVLAHEIKVSENLCLLVDGYHLRRVLYNLLGNAIKFTDCGSVLLRVDYVESELSIRVEDTGIGIPEENLEKVLQPFTRADNVSLRKGVGLGLSHACKISQSMGGDLRIESSLGIGTVVKVRIPAERHLGHSSANAKGSKDQPGRVLLVEDSYEIIALYNYYFSEAGVELSTVTNDVDLRKALGKFKPSIVLMDQNLGSDSGLELVQEIRADGYDGYIVLLTASVNVDQKEERKAIAAGCDEYIQKPADVASLAERINARLRSILAEEEIAPFGQLLKEYVASFPEKRTKLLTELLRFQATAENEKNIKTLKLHTHNISGSAGAYGFPDISDAAIQLERSIDQYENQPHSNDSQKIAQNCQALVETLEKQIALSE